MNAKPIFKRFNRVGVAAFERFNTVRKVRRTTRTAEIRLYKTPGENFFAVSGRADGKNFYRKTMRNARGQFIIFMIEYDESQKTVYDKAVAKMIKSFK